MYSNIRFVGRLKELMKDRDISKTELAIETGISETVIHNLLKGDLSCGADVLLTFMDFFEVTGEYLFGRSDDPKKC